MLLPVTKTPAMITRRLRYVDTEVAQQEGTLLSNVLASAPSMVAVMTRYAMIFALAFLYHFLNSKV